MKKRRGRSNVAWVWTAMVLSATLLSACSEKAPSRIHAFAEGNFSITNQQDSTKDFSGFEIVLVTQTEGDVDTLGVTETNVKGDFRMDISALEEGVFPFIVSRAGTRLAIAEFVVVEGDTTTVSGSFPLGGRRLRIVSPENAAWTAYRNAKALHNQRMLDLVQSQTASSENMFNTIASTSTILWSLRSSYPSSMATKLASAESVVMLEGWQDSLVIARLPELGIDNSGIVGAVRAARRSVARQIGQDSSLSLLRSYWQRVPDESQKAELQMELVVALLDSFQNDLALQEALELRRLYPDSEWATWAARATYEIENLLPGMVAPAFQVVLRNGIKLSSERLLGKFLILEFFEPTDDIFIKEIGERNTVFQLLNENVFQILSISIDPDSVVNEALFEEATPPGMFAFADGGKESDIARLYNVHVIPTRFLIDPDGLIVSKYTRSGMLDLKEDLIAIIARLNQMASQPN
ncbi:MAG: hypothetical protein BMS9Abin05_0092 [Rhodothermia bacterium]|nr:MAG: hypothetical protein BMS9Abin05_0092 [Rhodothermia bacterium]